MSLATADEVLLKQLITGVALLKDSHLVLLNSALNLNLEGDLGQIESDTVKSALLHTLALTTARESTADWDTFIKEPRKHPSNAHIRNMTHALMNLYQNASQVYQDMIKSRLGELALDKTDSQP